MSILDGDDKKYLQTKNSSARTKNFHVHNAKQLMSFRLWSKRNL